MIELKERHTSEYLKQQIELILTEYHCNLRQIFCCTTDNGANMVKCVKLLECDQESEITENEDNNDEDITKEIIGSLSTLRCVRCASHTLQVSIYNFK